MLSQRRFGNSRLDGVRAETSLGLDDVVAAAVDEYAAPALVFSGDVTVADQRLASRLGATYPGLLVYSRHTEVAGLGTEPLLAQVRAFGTTLDAGEGRPVDNWERIARLVHEDYIRTYPDPDDPARRPWAELAPFYRESNVRQVLTVLGSAVAVGRSWGASAETASPPSDEQLDEMARREHDVVARAPPAQRLDLGRDQGPGRQEAPGPAAVGPALRRGPRQEPQGCGSRAWPCSRRWATAPSTTPSPPGCASGAAARSPPYAATSRGRGPPPTAPRCAARPATGR